MTSDRRNSGVASIAAQAWRDAAGVAGMLFLSLLVVASVLLVAGKLQFPSLGSGASPLDVLRAIGLVALACLGVTVEIDDLPLSVLPLGALAAAAFLAYRLSRPVLSDRLHHPLLDGLKIGAPFGVLCLLGSLVFRFGGDVPVAASALESLIVGLIWGSMFGAAGSALADRGGLGGHPAVATRSLGLVRPELRGGVRAGGVMIGLASYGGLVGLLSIVVGRLASSDLPRNFQSADALAGVVYLAAFLPNAVAAVLTLGMGGSLTIGAQVQVSGRTIGPLREISLLDPGTTPAALLVLLAVPLVTTAVAGAWVGRRERDLFGAVRSIVLGAVVLAAALGVTAAIGDARLGGGLVREEGLGLVAIEGGKAALLALCWGSIGGSVGAAADRVLRAKKGRPR